MSSTQARAENNQNAPTPKRSSEMFWRVLAVVMLLSAGWVGWIAFQLSAPGLVLPEAFEAAAKAKATRNTAGTIQSAAPSASAPAEGAASSPAEAGAAGTAIEPPINADKLRMAESIETPINDKARRAPKPAAGDAPATPPAAPAAPAAAK